MGLIWQKIEGCKYINLPLLESIRVYHQVQCLKSDNRSFAANCEFIGIHPNYHHDALNIKTNRKVNDNEFKSNRKCGYGTNALKKAGNNIKRTIHVTLFIRHLTKPYFEDFCLVDRKFQMAGLNDLTCIVETKFDYLKGVDLYIAGTKLFAQMLSTLSKKNAITFEIEYMLLLSQMDTKTCNCEKYHHSI